MKTKKMLKVLKKLNKKLKQMIESLDDSGCAKMTGFSCSGCEAEKNSGGTVKLGNSTFKRGSASDGGQTVDEIKADRERS